MKKNRTFSSLKPIGYLIPDNLKKLIKNKPFSNYDNLKKSWSSILGKQLADMCQLIKVEKYNEKNSIFLKVDRKNLIEVDYSRDEIIKKINSFLGFEFASKILINIEDKKSPQVNKKSLKLNIKTKNLINSIKDEELRKKLSSFSIEQND